MKLRILSLVSVITITVFIYSMEPASMSLQSQEIVKKLLAIREAERASSTDYPELMVSLSDYYQKLYPQYEANFNKYKKLIPRNPVAGNINYLMSLDEIIAETMAKFKDMYQQGRIMTQEQFDKQNKDKWFYKGFDLSRIWGADYLARGFKEKGMSTSSVPKYIIVVKDLHKIQVRIVLGNCFPQIANIENGTVYAETIAGVPVATMIGKSGIDSTGLGYTDYSAAGNIIRSSNGIDYYVDTESKSFYNGDPGDISLIN